MICKEIVILLNLVASLVTGIDIAVSVNTFQVENTVSELFHGVALDSSLFTPTGLRSDLNLKSPKLATLLKALSPGYFRVGGTAANWLFFDLPSSKLQSLGYVRANIITKQNFDDLVQLTKKASLRFLFDLNAEMRYGDDWNPSDAIRLFEYCVQKNYGDNIDWELGNEPNQLSPSNLTTAQVAKDLIDFYKLFRTYDNLKNGAIVGPDVGWMGVDYIRRVADAAGDFLTAYTIHQYYFDGQTATVGTYLNNSHFQGLQKLFDKVRGVLDGSLHAKKQLWLGETSGGYNSGTVNVSDRYVSGFLYLDKLGLSAINNVNVVIRQTIFNGYYGLLDLKTLEPFPDYWLIFLHHTLVGQKVFKVYVKSSEKEPRTIRVYVQCTKISKSSHGPAYSKGAVTLFALNVHPTATFRLILTHTDLHGGPIDAYVLTPEPDNDVLSKKVKLNGKLLIMPSVTSLPKLTPVGVNNIELKPRTFGFFVFPDAKVAECQK